MFFSFLALICLSFWFACTEELLHTLLLCLILLLPFLFCLFSTTVCIPEFPVLLMYARIYGASKHECGAISLDGGRKQLSPLSQKKYAIT